MEKNQKSIQILNIPKSNDIEDVKLKLNQIYSIKLK